jgi:hypothetical protein
MPNKITKSLKYEDGALCEAIINIHIKITYNSHHNDEKHDKILIDTPKSGITTDEAIEIVNVINEMIL